MAKGKRRKATIQKKHARRSHAMAHPSSQSMYARKKHYCDRHGVFGFQIPHNKPWKS